MLHYLCFLFLGNISFPGTASFVGEFLVLLGVYEMNSFACFLASIGVIVGAAYSMWLYNRVFFGPVSDYFRLYADCNEREQLLLTQLFVFVLIMGIYPSVFTDVMHSSISLLIEL